MGCCEACLTCKASLVPYFIYKKNKKNNDVSELYFILYQSILSISFSNHFPFSDAHFCLDDEILRCQTEIVSELEIWIDTSTLDSSTSYIFTSTLKDRFFFYFFHPWFIASWQFGLFQWDRLALRTAACGETVMSAIWDSRRPARLLLQWAKALPCNSPVLLLHIYLAPKVYFNGI